MKTLHLVASMRARAMVGIPFEDTVFLPVDKKPLDLVVTHLFGPQLELSVKVS